MDKNQKKSKNKKESAPLLETTVTLIGTQADGHRASRYDQEDVNKFHREQISKGKAFSAFSAKIYGDRVDFKPNGKSKVLKMIRFAQIDQLSEIEGDANSIFIRVKHKKSPNGAACIIHFHEIQHERIFLKLVNEYKTSNVLQDSGLVGMKNDNHHTWKRKKTIAEESDKRELLNTSDGAQRQNGTNQKAGLLINQSYTSYCPDDIISDDENSDTHCDGDNFFIQDRMDASMYGDYERQSDMDICRDRASAFYGERMSPTSQYVDSCLRNFMKRKGGVL